MLKLDGLYKEYKRAGKPFNAVNNISLQIAQGSFINIIGRSGSGKSTLLNMLAGILIPSKGNIEFEELSYSYTNKTLDELSVFRNKNLGFIPQDTYLLSNFTVIENITLPFFIQKREDMPFEQAEKLLKDLDIPHLANSYPKELSGGEQRRVLIARALMNSPTIIIADEPTSDLDVENSKAVLALLQQINKTGVTIIMVTHELDTLLDEQFVYTMIDGTIKKGNAFSSKPH